ncbi:amidase [Sphingomonas sp. Leaf339]|uniref:amidase n=1 Tax=Sphingomonas sp. Leaf339 TaxID=1736343 RepID=UPI000AA70A20|nr:amidase [Sphingomonas sp. Leaf339]
MSDDDQDIRSFQIRCATEATGAEQTARACLARIAAHDRNGVKLAAMLRVYPEAIEVARARDRERFRGAAKNLPSLQGVPIAVKDNIDLLNDPTTSGCRALAGAMPRKTAPALAALLGAGAVVIGKTNLSEFSFEIRSRSSLGGDTRNPFAPMVTSGGSSGGTAVAVAAGFAMAGLGTDTGGSIRIPAAYNGLVGLRPTWGVVPITGVAPLAPSTDTVGTITRSVDDAMTMFAVLSANHNQRLRSARGMRVGVIRQLTGAVPMIAAGLENAVAALCAAGVDVDDAPDLPQNLIPAGDHIVDEEFGLAFDRYLRGNFHEKTAPASLAALIASGQYLPEYDINLKARARPRNPEIRTAILIRHAHLRSALDTIINEGRYDALLYPPSAVLPLSMDNPKGGWAPELAACSGWPALAVPVGQSAQGFPLSVELLARANAEPTLFTLGAAIERAMPRRLIPSW